MKKPIYKKWWFYLLIVLLIMSAGLTYVSLELSKILESNLRTALNKNPNRTYHIDFEGIQVELLRGNIAIKKLDVHPNQKALDSLNALDIHSSLLISLSIDGVVLKGIDMKKLINQEPVFVKEIAVKSPAIDMRFTGYKKQSKDTVSVAETLYEWVGFLQDLKVERITFSKADLNIHTPKFENALTAKGINIDMANFTIDTSLTIVPLDLNAFKVKVKELYIDILPQHKLTIAGLNTSYFDSTFSFTSLSMFNRQSKEDFSEGLEFEKPWQEIKTGKVEFTGFNFDRYLIDQEIFIRKVTAEKLDLHIYKDKTPKWPSHLVHQIPSAQIKSIPLPINLSELEIKKGQLLFEQKAIGHTDIGKLRLTKMNLTAKNITNIDSILKIENFLKIDGNMKMMGKGHMEAHLAFDMLSANNDFWVNTHLGKMDFADLNEFLFPLTNVEIEKGDLIAADVQLKCDSKRAVGELHVQYQEAKISIKKMNEEGNREDRGVISVLANTAVRSNNVKGSNSYKVGFVDFERSPDDPFFRFVWFSIQDGLENTLLGTRSMKEKRENREKRHKKGVRRKKRNKKNG